MTTGDDRIRQYLLGQLPPEEQDGLEEAYFSNDGYLQRVDAAEDELINAYVRNELPPPDRTSFETYFLSTPARRFRLVAVSELERSLSNRDQVVSLRPVRPAGHPARAWLLTAAAAALLFCGVSTYLFIQIQQAERLSATRQDNWNEQLAARDNRIAQLEGQLRARQETLRRTKDAAPPDTAPSALELLAFVLKPDVLNRGGQRSIPVLAVPPAVAAVQLRLELELDSADSYASYAATVTAGDGRRVIARDGLKPARPGNTVNLNVSRTLLPPGQYRVVLFGQSAANREEIDAYSFRVASP